MRRPGVTWGKYTATQETTPSARAGMRNFRQDDEDELSHCVSLRFVLLRREGFYCHFGSLSLSVASISDSLFGVAERNTCAILIGPRPFSGKISSSPSPNHWPWPNLSFVFLNTLREREIERDGGIGQCEGADIGGGVEHLHRHKLHLEEEGPQARRCRWYSRRSVIRSRIVADFIFDWEFNYLLWNDLNFEFTS